MDAATRLPITLEAQMWNGVIDALHNAPYRQAAPVIAEIMRQVQEHELKAQQAQQAAPEALSGEVIGPKANGAAHAGA